MSKQSRPPASIEVVAAASAGCIRLPLRAEHGGSAAKEFDHRKAASRQSHRSHEVPRRHHSHTAEVNRAQAQACMADQKLAVI
jgi:hypothetical protein